MAAGTLIVTTVPPNTIVDRQTNIVTQLTPTVTVLTGLTQGPPGVPGADGSPGPPGPPGPAGGTFVWTQSVAASTWTVVHNLGFYPNVSVVDTNKRQWMAGIQYIDMNSLTVSLSAPFAGQAFCT